MGSPEIYTLKEHGQLVFIDPQGLQGRLRPREGAPVQPLLQKPEAVAGPQQHLDRMAVPSTEQEQVAPEWIQVHLTHHHPHQAIHTVPQIRESWPQITVAYVKPHRLPPVPGSLAPDPALPHSWEPSRAMARAVS